MVNAALMALAATGLFGAAAQGEVRIFGALRPIIHQGKSETVVRLADLVIDSTTIGLGAASQLDGEITILNGDVHVARPRAGRIQETISKKPNAGACLLALASVPRWKSIVIGRAIAWKDLDQALEDLLGANGLDTDQRIPFLIEGRLRNLKAHVIDGTKLPSGPSSHEEHVSSGIRILAAETKGTLVGFFTKSDQGVLTHHTTNLHIHCVVPAQKSSGHLDEVDLPSGVVLKIPLR